MTRDKDRENNKRWFYCTICGNITRRAYPLGNMAKNMTLKERITFKKLKLCADCGSHTFKQIVAKYRMIKNKTRKATANEISIFLRNEVLSKSYGRSTGYVEEDCINWDKLKQMEKKFGVK